MWDGKGGVSGERVVDAFQYRTTDPRRRPTSRSDAPKVDARLQPTGKMCSKTVASRQRRSTGRRCGRSCPASVAQPSLRDGYLGWTLGPGAKATRLPSQYRYAVQTPLHFEETWPTRPPGPGGGRRGQTAAGVAGVCPAPARAPVDSLRLGRRTRRDTGSLGPAGCFSCEPPPGVVWDGRDGLLPKQRAL